jgi:16S rRNA U516 pseudouridylate synthase RsuA-like enzyme
MIIAERITLYGKAVTSPTFEVQPPDKGEVAVKVDGKLVHGIGSTLKQLQTELDQTGSDEKNDGTPQMKQTTKDFSLKKTGVWLCNKLKGELVTEDDPDGRRSMMQRLIRGGVGVDKKSSHLPTHLKPVGRLGM